MKLYDAFSAAGFHTCIATTFCIDFSAFESLVLPKLRGAGCTNNIVVADSRMLSMALSGDSAPPRFAGRLYSAIGVSASGVFHPKLILQLGRKSGRLLVASANLTGAGLAGNLEVVGQLQFDGDDATAAPVIMAALEYIEGLFDPSDTVVAQQLLWARQRSPWLKTTVASNEAVLPDDGERVQFLTASPRGIAWQFRQNIADERVKRVVVLSPYWDKDLRTVKKFVRELEPQKLSLAIQPDKGLFPKAAWSKVSAADVYSLSAVSEEDSRRFAHAKIVVVCTRERDHALFGSANFTEAALGPQGTNSNEEACLYRGMTKGTALASLGLHGFEDGNLKLGFDDISDFEPAGDLPLPELQVRSPGRFELRGAVLSWWPSVAASTKDCRIELFSDEVEPIGQPLGVSTGRMREGAFRFDLDKEVAPAFARVVAEGFVSALAVINFADYLQSTRRDAKSSKVKKVLEALEGAAGEDETVWMLSVINLIEDAENEERAAKIGARAATPRAKTSVELPDGEATLPYEEFVRGRGATKGAGQFPRSSLETSHLDDVRGQINALIDRVTALPALLPELDAAAAKRAFDPKDETDDGEALLEKGKDPTRGQVDSPTSQPDGSSNETGKAEKERLEERRRYFEHVKASHEKLAKATDDFVQSMAAKSSKGLGSADLLRLRVLIMIVAAAGTTLDEVKVTKPGEGGLATQTLPAVGNESWVALMGRPLFIFFMTRAGSHVPPLVSSVKLSVEFDHLPDDVVECFATCMWASIARRIAHEASGKAVSSGKNSMQLVECVYRHVSLGIRDLRDPRILSVISGMSKRYSMRLGFDADQLLAEHSRMCDWLAAAHAKVNEASLSLSK